MFIYIKYYPPKYIAEQISVAYRKWHGILSPVSGIK